MGQGVSLEVPSGIKGYANRVPGGQGVRLQGPRGSWGRPTGFQGIKGVLRCPIGSKATFDVVSCTTSHCFDKIE